MSSMHWTWSGKDTKHTEVSSTGPSVEEIIAHHENCKARDEARAKLKKLVDDAHKDPDLNLVLRAQAWARTGRDVNWVPNSKTLRWDPQDVPAEWPPGIDGAKVVADELAKSGIKE